MVQQLNVLVLQGGGAIGAYQAGAYEAMAAHGEPVNWVAGVSIGAINAAIIAGNPPNRRIERLRQFWSAVSAGIPFLAPGRDNPLRQFWNEGSAAASAFSGVPGFFSPRRNVPWPTPVNKPEEVSYYDTSPLRDTLGELIDFDQLNSGNVRLSVGAVDVRTGNSIYFDTTATHLGVKHIMASGALPPGFPPVKIEDNYFWDGGLVSNAPLQYVIDRHGDSTPLTVFQVDLFSARGIIPRSLLEIEAREKEIRFSSRTRLNTDRARDMHRFRMAVQQLVQRMPDTLLNDPVVRNLEREAEPGPVTILHLIYRRGDFETASRDYEFSRASMEEHWQAGYKDTEESLNDPRWQHRKKAELGFVTMDLTNRERN